MKIRFQADADLNQTILLATVRRESAMDFRTALAAGLANLGDREVLAMAAREGRVLVTHDQKSMPRHFSEFITTATSPGLRLFRSIFRLLLRWKILCSSGPPPRQRIV